MVKVEEAEEEVESLLGQETLVNYSTIINYAERE